MAIAQSIGTWLGDLKVASSSPTRTKKRLMWTGSWRVLVHILGIAKVLLSKAPAPNTAHWGLACVAAPSLRHKKLYTVMFKIIAVCLKRVSKAQNPYDISIHANALGTLLLVFRIKT